MPKFAKNWSCRRYGPRVTIYEHLVPQVDKQKGTLTRPAFAARALHFFLQLPSLKSLVKQPYVTEGKCDGPRVAIDPELTEQLDLVRKGFLSRPEFLARALESYMEHLND